MKNLIYRVSFWCSKQMRNHKKLKDIMNQLKQHLRIAILH